ncbi:MAG: hypothetical protein QNL04_11875 [SAR324 cluster bacterium]|nr:hypothetical protein [SAR324 cluster bacterium]
MDLFKGSEEKQKAEMESHYALGMEHLGSKFYNRAMIEFQKALEINHEEIYPRLLSELDNFSGSDIEAALSIGLNLLKDNPTDYELANKLGNFARELENFDQASNLYKMAMKANKGYEPAFYNLAACGAKVDLYDEAAKSSIEQFESLLDYILPEYIGENPAEVVGQKILERKEKAHSEKLQSLQVDQEQKQELGDAVGASQVGFEISMLEKEKIVVEPKDIMGVLKSQIDKDPATHHNMRYNLGLYALGNNAAKVALWAFGGLDETEFDKKNLLEAISLDKSGKLDEAIDKVTGLLGKDEFSRYNNVNLGLMFQKAGKRFLATKYLLKTASLLEKSGGHYSMKAVVAAADAAKEEKNIKKALNYYQIAATEIKDKRLWIEIGEILVELKKYDEAVANYRELKLVDPDGKEADNNLKKIHDYYATKGDALVTERKFKAAIDYYRKALSVVKFIATLKKAAKICSELSLSEEASQYLDMIDDLEREAKEAVEEEKRQEFITEGLDLIKAKNYYKAITTLESAFRMKLDKKVFLNLAGLYKGLKKVDDLNSLVQRWAKMVEHAERMSKFNKAAAREKQGDDGLE